MKKIFISYKYWDSSVYQNIFLDKINNPNTFFLNEKKVTPRSYVNALSAVLKDYSIEKWEKDGEDLSQFKESTIQTKLKNKIYDSSLTIVLISPKMKDDSKSEDEQWIPWEVSYSLKEISRNGRTSLTNAMLMVVLPDSNNSYDYCVEYKDICDADSLNFDLPFCFDIIRRNFFNSKSFDRDWCDRCNNYHYHGSPNSYFVYVRWKDFVINPGKYIDLALENQKNKENFNISKEI